MISFFDAASELEGLCDRIDALDELDPQVSAIFINYRSNLCAAIDKRISFINYAQSQSLLAKERGNEWHKRHKKFERIIEKLKDDTINVINSSPNLPYVGTLGTLKVQNNSMPSVVLEENILNSEYFKIIKTPDRQRVKDDLLNGVKVKGASLEYGKHLRIHLK